MKQLPIRYSHLWTFILLVYFFYFSQGVFYKTGSLLSQSAILLVLLIGVYSCILIFLTQDINKIPSHLKLILLLLLILGGTFIISPKVIYFKEFHAYGTTTGQFKNQCVYLLSIFTGYLIGRNKKLPNYQIMMTVIILLIFCIFLFYSYYALSAKPDPEKITNNHAYNFIYFLPFIALIINRHKTFALICFVAVFFFVITGVKRGAMVCLASCIIYGLWWWKQYKGLNYKALILISILTIAAIIFIQYTLETSSYFEKRMNDMAQGNSSNRDTIYSDLLNYWLFKADIFHMIFGHGSAQTTAIAMNYAHQDWLELLIDIGLIGVIVYAAIFINLYKFIARSHVTPEIRLSLNLILIIWFMKSLFSMGIDSITGGLDMMLLGYLSANIVKETPLNKELLHNHQTTQ